MPKPPLTNEELKELVLLTSQNLKISDPSIIEKDYYVTYLLQEISVFENEHFDLIFTGGTCLAKAYHVVKRMSEDIDFRIQEKSIYTKRSRSSRHIDLRNFRKDMLSLIKNLGFEPNSPKVKNEGKYIRIEVNYPKLFQSDSVLRPHLLLEFNFSQPKLKTIELSVKSLIEEACNVQPLFTPNVILCTSLQEIGIEKWVGLIRRISAINHNYINDDETLVRHMYDLNCLDKSKKIGKRFYSLANEKLLDDGRQFQKQNPDFYSNPIEEIIKSMSTLKNDKIWNERYHNFIDSMVYDLDSKPEFFEIISSLEKITKKILDGLDNQGLEALVKSRLSDNRIASKVDLDKL